VSFALPDLRPVVLVAQTTPECSPPAIAGILIQAASLQEPTIS